MNKKYLIITLVVMMVGVIAWSDDTQKAFGSSITSDEGLLLGLSCMEEKKPDNHNNPQPGLAKYKTIWIASQEGQLEYREKNGMIVAPGADGFYIYKNVPFNNQSADKSKYIINKITLYRSGQEPVRFEFEIDRENGLDYYSEANNLLFVGNNYALVQTNIIYTSGAGGYQYDPSIHLFRHGNIGKTWVEKGYSSRKDSGVPLNSLLDAENKNTLDIRINQYKLLFNRTVKVESKDDKEYISENDLSLKRRDGSWRLVVPLIFSNWKQSHVFIKEYEEIDCILPASLVSYNELCLRWRF